MTTGVKYTPYQRALFEALWYAGISESIICGEFGIARQTVGLNAKHFGLDPRGKSQRHHLGLLHDTRSVREKLRAIRAEVRAQHNPWKQAAEKMK